MENATIEVIENNQPTRKQTRALVQAIKADSSDFEFYPSTPEILATIKSDIGEDENPSILDIGAGDGRSLLALTKGKRYAIEKSKPLINAMDKSVFIVGTDFEFQTLIDKKTEIIFSNPPYGQYEQWVCKILQEANCKNAYLVIPRRWKDNETITQLIEKREAKTEVIGEFDFNDAHRQARANVEIVKVSFAYSGHRSSSLRVDPFDMWFEENFKLDINKTESSKYDWEKSSKARMQESLKNELVAGRDVVIVLEQLYQAELEKLMSNYKSLEKIDPALLEELDVNIDGLKDAVRMKVEGLKDRYWQELFDNLTNITSRLCTSARKRMLDRLMQHTHVDFTVSNAYAILIWVIKNANSYFDSQLVDLVEKMTEQATVTLYKSNERIYGDNDWRYCRTPESLDRYSLEFRMVLHRVGGLCRSQWEHERRQYNGLSEGAMTLLRDIQTVANNAGFDTTRSSRLEHYYWESNSRVDLFYYDAIRGESLVLMSVRAFYNGNIHIKFNQRFMKRLNVEFGRLKGWIKNPKQAADEMDIELGEAELAFGSTLQLAGNNLLQLCFSHDQ